MALPPVIILTGAAESAAWAKTLRQTLIDAYTFTQYAERTGYVTRLADDHAALIVVDGNDPDWRFWATTPKVSPATRRIPVFVVSDEAATRADALLAGADMALSPDDMMKDGARLITEFARVFDAALVEQLDCECDESLPDLAEQGFEKFNAGEYYKQHDLFEALWVQTDGPVRDLYRAILQVGIAYYQILRGNHRGARKMLLRSVQWLTILPDACQGIDLKALREDAARVRAELERLREDEIDQFDRALLQPVRKISPQAE